MAGSNETGRRYDGPAQGFARAVQTLRDAVLRPEITVAEAPPPARLAPYTAAFTADVSPFGDARGDKEDLATGRLVLLHDPAGLDAWSGRFRLVSYLRAALDPEMAADAMLGAVGWSWLVEALATQGAAYVAPSGTVTRVASESFGGIAGEVTEAEIEIRASWTPIELPDLDFGPHLVAWGDLLATVAGLPPVGEGVVPLPGPRTKGAPRW